MLLEKNMIDINLSESMQDFRTWYQMKIAKMPMRNIDIAKTMGIAEGKLLSAHQVECMKPSSANIASLRQFIKNEDLSMVTIALKNTWPEIIEYVKNFGEVMALTRNDACVMEKIGIYQSHQVNHHIGLMQGEIELRIFYEKWHAGFLVIENKSGREVLSLQFFNQLGQAIHKIYMRGVLKDNLLNELIENFSIKSNCSKTSLIHLTTFEDRFKNRIEHFVEDRQVDVDLLRKKWSEMRDTHEFHNLFKEFNISRTQALRLIGAEYATRVDQEAIEDVLRGASEERIPLLIFVSNSGVLHIHHGCIYQVSKLNCWLNILDGNFNLHLRESLVDQIWIVRKPTIDGIVSSLELFDRQGELIALLFGDRKLGEPENSQWRQLIENICEVNV